MKCKSYKLLINIAFLVILVVIIFSNNVYKAAYQNINELSSNYTYGSVKTCELLVGTNAKHDILYSSNVMASFDGLTFCGISENAGYDNYRLYSYWNKSVTCKDSGYSSFSLEFSSGGLNYKGFGCRKEKNESNITCTNRNADIYTEVQVETNNTDNECSITKGNDIAHFSDSSQCKVYFNGIGEVEVRITNKKTGSVRCVAFMSKDIPNENTTGNISNNTSSNNGTVDTGPRNDYENICSNEGVKNAVLFIGKLVTVAIWVVPLIIIVLGMVDFAKAMMSQDEKAISKATGALIKRVVAGLAVFIIPTVILSLLKTVGITKNAEQSSEYKSCINCLLYPYNNCQPNTTQKSNGVTKPGVDNQNQLIK